MRALGFDNNGNEWLVRIASDGGADVGWRNARHTLISHWVGLAKSRTAVGTNRLAVMPALKPPRAGNAQRLMISRAVFTRQVRCLTSDDIMRG